MTLNRKQCEVLHCNYDDVFITFTKLFKNGLIYRTVSSSRDKALRDDTVCIFKSEDNSIQFGLIDLFIVGVDPTVLIYKLILLSDTILEQAGYLCRSTLLDYQAANLLGKYITPVQYQRTSLTAIRIDAILERL